MPIMNHSTVRLKWSVPAVALTCPKEEQNIKRIRINFIYNQAGSIFDGLAVIPGSNEFVCRAKISWWYVKRRHITPVKQTSAILSFWKKIISQDILVTEVMTQSQFFSQLSNVSVGSCFFSVQFFFSLRVKRLASQKQHHCLFHIGNKDTSINTYRQ